ncbi:hypothetical protein D3X11_04210 [Streptococcus sp. X16XC17]|uniref:hypothetical protein n=1 Tax=unclassified Streptococcus TaxID=2608887 RepID=UPI00066FC80D|nr:MULTISPECIES: hypothetical protein [unclassified Streptococcus]TCD46595.1 hypothetical protein D3X11_04210 [Streptococcus sp. X16XC17]
MRHTIPLLQRPAQFAWSLLRGGEPTALAGVLLGAFYYYTSNSNYETEINKLHMLLEASEMVQQLEEIEKLQVDKATVTNDQTIFKNLEGDLRCI